jgi:hypothetical protein
MNMTYSYLKLSQDLRRSPPGCANHEHEAKLLPVPGIPLCQLLQQMEGKKTKLSPEFIYDRRKESCELM